MWHTSITLKESFGNGKYNMNMRFYGNSKNITSLKQENDGSKEILRISYACGYNTPFVTLISM